MLCGRWNTGLCPYLANALLLSHTPNSGPVDFCGPREGMGCRMLAHHVGKGSRESREYHGTVCLSMTSKASEVHLPQVASTAVETLR